MTRIPALIDVRSRATGVWLFLFVFGWMCGSLGGKAHADPTPLPATISLDEIRPGMQGYGLSVFSGSQVDTFQVTVIGVQSATRVDGSLILIEVAGHGLELARVVQGMSGSPVFIEGRFAGALAFGWGGSLKPIAGVTPAREILGLPTEMPRISDRRIEASAFDPAELVAGGPAGLQLARMLEEIDPKELGPAPTVVAAADRLPTGWPEPGELIQSLLPQLQEENGGTQSWICQPLRSGAAGRQDHSSAETLVPGSACAIPLITGDAQLGAIGTVTWVQDEHVFMMGHPFMQRGPISFPLATAEILTVLPSREMSFKMGSIGTTVGAVHHDQRAGLSGRLGATAPMIPVEVTIRDAEAEPGVEPERFRFEVVDDSQMGPSLVFWALYNSLLARGDDASLQTVDYRLQTTWTGNEKLAAEPLVLTGTTAGPAGVRALAGQWMAPLNLLMNNPFEPLRLTGVRAELTVQKDLQQATITSLTGPQGGVRPGQEAVYKVTLTPRRGPERVLEIPVTFPAHLGAGPYRVVAASAAELFGLEAQRAAGRFQLRTLDDTLNLLATERSANTLALAVLAPGRGLVLGGKEMPSLPGSVSRFLRRGNLQVGRTLADYVLRSDLSTEWMLMGNSVLELKISPSTRPLPDERRP